MLTATTGDGAAAPSATTAPRASSLLARLRRNPIAVMTASKIVIGLALATTVTLLILHLRAQALREATAQIQGMSLVLADQAERSFEAVELVETGVIKRMEFFNIRTPGDFREQMASPTAGDDLHARLNGLPQIEALSALDDDGNLLNSSRPDPVHTVNAADRDYFKALRADAELSTFIGEAKPNRTTGEWTIFVARRVSGPGGSFLGVVVALVKLSYFEQLYQSVAFGPGSALALFRDDGNLLARYPPATGKIGDSFATHTVFRQIAAGQAPDPVVREFSLVDGQERLISAHKLGRYPLVLTASKTLNVILADWRRQSAALIAGALLLELILVAAGLMVRRQFRAEHRLADAETARASADTARRAAEVNLALTHERQRAERELHLQDVRFGVAMSNMSQALCMFDGDNRLVVANSRLAEMFDMSPSSFVIGASLEDLLTAAHAKSNLSSQDIDTIGWTIRRLREDAAPSAYIRELSDGRALSVSFTPMEDQGWLMTIEDITERRLAEARIEHMALHDALTGLPNRVLFHDKLDEAIARSRRGDGCAVLCLDLDHFKSVNDTLGHPVGDALLKDVTARLLQQLRDTDTVARLGGDEFAVVQASANQPTDATALAMRLIDALSAPYEVLGHQVVISTSIGIAVVPGDGNDTDQILRNADMALYRAKSDGRGRYRFFEAGMDARMQSRRLLELDLRKALVSGEFQVFYQPLMNLDVGTISTFEALLRWKHATRGMIAPAEFIPLAEEIGLIIPLGRQVLRQACADAATWPEDVKVAVNLSPAQFGSRTLVRDVADILTESGLAPHRLELEITETVMLAETEATLAILYQLRDLGVSVVMDDFGTGYSSLSYLRRFPFDKVKIDRSFIEGLGKGGDCEAIVQAIGKLCESLGMQTTAEGVETPEQLAWLKAGPCTEAQGYLFSRAQPASEVARLCRTLNQPKLMVA